MGVTTAQACKSVTDLERGSKQRWHGRTLTPLNSPERCNDATKTHVITRSELGNKRRNAKSNTASCFRLSTNEFTDAIVHHESCEILKRHCKAGSEDAKNCGW